MIMHAALLLQPNPYPGFTKYTITVGKRIRDNQYEGFEDYGYAPKSSTSSFRHAIGSIKPDDKKIEQVVSTYSWLSGYPSTKKFFVQSSNSRPSFYLLGKYYSWDVHVDDDDMYNYFKSMNGKEVEIFIQV